MATGESSIERSLAEAIGLLNAGQRERAEAVLARALAQQPQHPALLQLRAVIALERGDAALAHRDAKASLQTRADHVPTLLLAARAAAAAGLADAAAEHAERALAQAPDDPRLACTCAALLLDAGRVARADACLRATTDRHPGHAKAWYERGRVERVKGEPVAARGAFERALALSPQWVPARFALSLACQDVGDVDAARAALEAVLAAQPDDVQAAVNLGVLLQTQGSVDAAMAYYGRAFRARPETFGRIANALCSEPHGRLWLDLDALAHALRAA